MRHLNCLARQLLGFAVEQRLDGHCGLVPRALGPACGVARYARLKAVLLLCCFNSGHALGPCIRRGEHSTNRPLTHWRDERNQSQRVTVAVTAVTTLK